MAVSPATDPRAISGRCLLGDSPQMLPGMQKAVEQQRNQDQRSQNAVMRPDRRHRKWLHRRSRGQYLTGLPLDGLGVWVPSQAPLLFQGYERIDAVHQRGMDLFQGRSKPLPIFGRRSTANANHDPRQQGPGG